MKKFVKLRTSKRNICIQIVNISERCEHAQNGFEPSASNGH